MNGRTVSIRPNTSDLSVFWQIFVERHYDLPYPRSPALIVDAGANVGFSTVFFAIRYPSATVIAIEPDHGNFCALQRNVMGLKNVLPLRRALWWNDERLAVEDPGIGEWGYRVAPNISGAIPAITMEDIVRRYGRVDLLKLDVEGAEQQLFEHPQWMCDVDAIAVELHERIHAGVSEVFDIATHDFVRSGGRGEIILVTRR